MLEHLWLNILCSTDEMFIKLNSSIHKHVTLNFMSFSLLSGKIIVKRYLIRVFISNKEK